MCFVKLILKIMATICKSRRKKHYISVSKKQLPKIVNKVLRLKKTVFITYSLNFDYDILNKVDVIIYCKDCTSFEDLHEIITSFN